LALIGITHLTHINGEGMTNPYGIVKSVKDGVLGVAYAVLGIATNLGANPAYDATILKNLPTRLVEQIFSIAGLAYLIVITGMIYATWLLWRFLRSTVPRFVKQTKKQSQAKQLAVMLVSSTIVSIGLFVVTNHYYPVDARYMTIVFFTLFIVATIELRQRHMKPLALLAIGGVLSIAIVLSSVAALRTHNRELDASNEMNGRNTLIAGVLARHKVNLLVADYWRALPIRALSTKLQVMPLSGCTTAAQALTSAAWQSDLKKDAFAYLLSLERSSTGYPDCSIDQILHAYGAPNSSIVIKGKVSDPKELLLFYDHGIRVGPIEGSRLKTPLSSTILPIKPSDLQNTQCSGHSVMNIVAHQDDDLLFMSPDLIHTIQAGDCVRSVYMTAGDAGQDTSYWLGRQLGAEAAYNAMYGKAYSWSQHIVQFGPDQYVTIASPRNNPKISLIFLNLPDGNPDGTGFATAHYESLSSLYDGKVPAMHSVDGHSIYTSTQLVSALSSIMTIYRPDEIRSQADVSSQRYRDHSDHITTGMFAAAALTQYAGTLEDVTLAPPLYRYIGYPIHGYDSNVSGDDLTLKQAAFFAYALFDNGVCHSIDECDTTAVYGTYLDRQYLQE
jgi:LmbE family N-acetylglucosaminyl deacetylase